MEAIRAAAPDADDALGGLEAEHGWPLRLGTTSDVPALLDRLFLYAYAVEQAKRRIREDPPLPALPGLRSPKDQVWIFQGNPDSFDLDGYLRATPTISWTVRQRHLADRITVGDRVFIWRAKGKGTAAAGVIAAGKIIELPRVQPEHEPARHFWNEAHEAEALRVRIQIERYATSEDEMIRRERIKEDPALRDLRILKMASETNYEIDPEHGQRLEEIWLNTRRDSNEVDAGVGEPQPVRRSRVQGYEPNPAVRRAVEEWAMARAEAHYRAQGFDVERTAATKPYDFRCTRKDLEIRVEVKGSRGDATTVEVTIGEVENARGTEWRTDLFIVSRIDIDDGPVASGGAARCVEGWKANPEDLSPTRFRCTVPAKQDHFDPDPRCS